MIADPIVRNRGTIGGSLCQADPAEDLSTVCDVLGAEAVIRGPAGERILAMADFHRGPYETAVGQDELLCELRFPIRPRSGSAYEKVERRVGDWAVGAAGASVTLAADGTIADAAVGLTALGLDHTGRRGRRTAPRPAAPGGTVRRGRHGSPRRPATRWPTSAARLTTNGISPTNSPGGSCDRPVPAPPGHRKAEADADQHDRQRQRSHHRH